MNAKKAIVSDGTNRDKVVVEGKEYGILGRDFLYCETFSGFLRSQGVAGVAQIKIASEVDLATMGLSTAYMVEYSVDGAERFAYVCSSTGTDDFVENYVVSSVRIPALEELGRNGIAKYRRAVMGE